MAEFDESKHPRDRGKFSSTEGDQGEHATNRDSPMHERVAPGGDLHERATASLQDHAFVQQHADRLSRAGDEVRARHPHEEHGSDAVHAEAQQAIHFEAMRALHEQDTIGGNPHLQDLANTERRFANFRGDDTGKTHEGVMNEINRARVWAGAAHQRDLDAQSRGFADAATETRHRDALADADAQSRGFANAQTEQEHKEAEEAKATRADEDQAIAAGHVSGAAREIGDRYEAAIKEHQAAAAVHVDALHQAHGEAADALAALHEYSNDDHEMEHATPGLTEQFGETQTALHGAIGRDEHEGYERESSQRESPVHPDEADLANGERYLPYEHVPHPDEERKHELYSDHAEQLAAHEESQRRNAPFVNRTELEHVPHPDRSEHELTDEQYDHQLAAHEAWQKKAEAVYNEAIDAHHAEFQRRAEAAQSALERLHEHQVAAHAGLKASSTASNTARSEATKALDKIDPDELVNHAAFAHHERDYGNEDNTPESHGDEHDHQYLVDDKAREDYGRAEDAAQSSLDHAQNRIDERRFNATEALDPLKESTRSTRDAIKELARITGRAPRLPEKPKSGKTKKSANRPGPGPGASVWGMAAPTRFKLSLKSLQWISLVDHPAQEPAAIRLIKRKDGPEQIEATLTARVVWPTAEQLAKTSAGADPLVYGWAFTCTDETGAAYHDLQDDAVQPDFLKAAEEWLRKGGGIDEMHDGVERGSYAAFAFPWDADIASALLGPEVGKLVKTSGLMIAVRPTAEQLAKLRTGEYNGFSIAGTGIRELVKAATAQPKCEDCGAYGSPKDDGNCSSCGKAMKRTAVPVVPVPALSTKATRPAASRKRRPPRAGVRKQAVLTSTVDGHQHQIDLDDPADGWSDQLTTSYNTAEGSEQGHSHAWVYDDAGKITIAQDSGHTHTIEAVVPADVIRQAQLNESGKRCPGCGEMCEASCRFCPGCGAALDRRDAPQPAPVSNGGGAAVPPVVVIAARAPRAISTPAEPTPTVKGTTEEPTMPDPAQTEEIRTLKAENALLKGMSTLTDAARRHYEQLIAKGVKSDADAFLALTKAQRDTLLAEITRADAEVYTSKSTGRVYKQSDALEIIEAAKATDAMAETQKRLDGERRQLEFAKRGAAIVPMFAKGLKGNLQAGIMEALALKFTDPAELAEAELALKQANVALEKLTKSIGYSSTGDEAMDTPSKRFESAVNDFAKRNNLTYAIALEKGTASDPEIRRLYNELAS